MKRLVLCVVLLCCASGSAFAQGARKRQKAWQAKRAATDLNQGEPLPWWGFDLSLYKGTGVWQDSQGNEGKLEISFVIEDRGDQENFWLTINYGETASKIFASRMWDDSSPYKLFALDGYPIGDAVIVREADAPRYEIIYDVGSVIKRVVEDGITVSLSGTTEEGLQWNTVELG